MTMFSFRTWALAAIIAGFGVLGSGTSARANIVFDFAGVCAINTPGYSPQSACTGTSTGVLTLADTYVFGSNLTLADFISLTYKSNAVQFTISPADGELAFGGGITASGGINAVGDLQIRVVQG